MANDELSAAGIAAALSTRWLGRPAWYLPSTGSTNDVVQQQARLGAAEGLVVVADEQTAGRGRLERRWWSPPGVSLLFSLLLRIPLPLARAGQLTMCLGLAAVEGIEQATGLRADLKWPNDLTLGGRKLAGMLSELQTAGGQLEYAVLGLGLNVNLGLEVTPGGAPAPAEVAAAATSLRLALGRPVPRLPLLAAILAAGERWFDRLRSGESPHLAWADRLETLGRDVLVSLPAGPVRGRVTGVTPEGGLALQPPAGPPITIWAGDVTSLRPEPGDRG